MDRLDIQIEVPSLKESELVVQAHGDSTEIVRARVECARNRQLERQGTSNGQLAGSEIDEHCRIDEVGANLVKQAIVRLNLSARGYHRILKLARTIADLSGNPVISPADLAEAIQYRRLDRAY